MDSKEIESKTHEHKNKLIKREETIEKNVQKENKKKNAVNRNMDCTLEL